MFSVLAALLAAIIFTFYLWSRRRRRGGSEKERRKPFGDIAIAGEGVLKSLESIEDVNDAASCMARAFGDSPWYAYIFKHLTGEKRREALEFLFRRNLSVLVEKERGALLGLRRDGIMACCFVLSSPASRKLSLWEIVRAGILEMGFRFGFSSVKRMMYVIQFNEVEEAKFDVNSKLNSKVQRMVVDPRFQGRGLGSKCIAAALAARKGETFDLTTNEARNVPFYKRAGFELYGEFYSEEAKVNSWYMKRPVMHTLVVDLRPTHVFMGWTESGGHVEGSVNFPIEWFTRKGVADSVSKELDENFGRAIQNAMQGKDGILLFGALKEDMDVVAKHLRSKYGVMNVSIHSNGELKRPMTRVPGYETFVYPEWIEENRSHIKLFHVNSLDDYEKGHIPGAVWLDMELLESNETNNRQSPDELEHSLRKLGIAKNSRVVLTSNLTLDKRTLNASYRALVILKYCGVKDVRVLDGGLDVWIGAGYGLTSTPATSNAVPLTGLSIPENLHLLVDMEEAREMKLISVRSFPERRGDKSGYTYIEHAGDIAGSLFANSGSSAYHLENFRNPDNRTMLCASALAEKFARIGIRYGQRNAHYCGTGWRASESWAYAVALGSNSCVYDGGWFEWTQHSENRASSFHPEWSDALELEGKVAPDDGRVGDLKLKRGV